ncbi:MAG: HNH endonuclease [Ignavibacteria bacterium]|nr:HNH endonuclease [Ignavibacteria bacterium]
MKNDFTSRTKLELAKRAGEKCSICKITTSKPKLGKEGFINIGEAAHIKGNRYGKNNRFDNSMSIQERKNFSNAIWLCPTCHKKIDSDESLYTVNYLIKIKQDHELEVFNGIFDINHIPIIKKYEDEILLLNKLIKEKEKSIKISERLYSQELNILKDKLYNIETEKNEKNKSC